MSPRPKRQARAARAAVRLTPEQLARAVAANTLWASKLGWIQHVDAIAVLTGGPAVVASADFAQAVAKWQAAHQLDVDGILGRDTWREIRHALTPPDALITVLPADAPPPPDGFEAIIAAFGDPRPLLTDGTLSPESDIIWERQTLARGQFPFPLALSHNNPSAGVARSFQAHRRLVSVFEAVFAEIARVGLADAIHSYG